jgi:multiple sugar transport system permease protein
VRRSLFYLCISPWLLGFLLFTLGPITGVAGLQLYTLGSPLPGGAVGLRNYGRMLDDPLFWQSLSVTLRYTLMYVPTELIGGLLLALLMNQVGVRGIRGVRTIYYLPSVISGVAFVVVWMWLFHPEAGLINATLALFGVTGPRWLADPRTALYALWMMSLWGLGRTALIFLAGLKGVPKELYEAAAMDGAGACRRSSP